MPAVVNRKNTFPALCATFPPCTAAFPEPRRPANDTGQTTRGKQRGRSQIHFFHIRRSNGCPQKEPAHLREAGGVIGCQKVQVPTLLRLHALAGQLASHGIGGGGGRVHQAHIGANHILQAGAQGGKVRAAQQQGVGRRGHLPTGLRGRVEDGVKVAGGHSAHHLAIQPPFLGQRHKERAGPASDDGLGAPRVYGPLVGPPLMVPSVAITAMCPLREASQAAAAPGSMTPMTGRGAKWERNTCKAALVAVLQAITSIFMPRSTSLAAACRE